jgi:hypothetical protein
MHDLLAALVHADSATPIPEQTVDPTLVTPGPVGFVVIAVLALAVIVLVWDMMRRIRRGRVRADINEELDAEQQAAAAARATEVDDQDIDAGPSQDRAPGADGTTPKAPRGDGSGPKAS